MGIDKASNIQNLITQLPRNLSPELEQEFNKIYSAISSLMFSLDPAAGAGATDSVVVIAQENLPVGAPVYITGSGTDLIAYLADMSVNRPTYAFVSQTTDILAGKTGRVSMRGNNVFLSGLTVGALYYTGITPGVYTNVDPGGADSQIVGIAISETSLFMSPNLVKP